MDTTTRTTLATLSTDALAGMNRADLRLLFKAAIGQPADRSVLDRSSEMRALLAAKAEAVRSEIEAEAKPAKEKKAKAPKAPKAPKAEAVEAAPRESKWTAIVGNLWALREGEEAVEVKIPVETLVEMGLPSFATKFSAAWNANPPGQAARALGLVTSLRTDRESGGKFLLIRKGE